MKPIACLEPTSSRLWQFLDFLVRKTPDLAIGINGAKIVFYFTSAIAPIGRFHPRLSYLLAIVSIFNAAEKRTVFWNEALAQERVHDLRSGQPSEAKLKRIIEQLLGCFDLPGPVQNRASAPKDDLGTEFEVTTIRAFDRLGFAVYFEFDLVRIQVDMYCFAVVVSVVDKIA